MRAPAGRGRERPWSGRFARDRRRPDSCGDPWRGGQSKPARPCRGPAAPEPAHAWSSDAPRARNEKRAPAFSRTARLLVDLPDLLRAREVRRDELLDHGAALRERIVARDEVGLRGVLIAHAGGNPEPVVPFQAAAVDGEGGHE